MRSAEDVIAEAIRYDHLPLGGARIRYDHLPLSGARRIIEALREEGYDIVPAQGSVTRLPETTAMFATRNTARRRHGIGHGDDAA